MARPAARILSQIQQQLLPQSYAQQVARRREAAIAAEPPTGEQMGWGEFGLGALRAGALGYGGGAGLRSFDAFRQALSGGEDLDPRQHPPLPLGRFVYKPGRMPGRDLPEVEPSSALRQIEGKQGLLGEYLHGTTRSYERADPVGDGVLGNRAHYVASRDTPSYPNRFASHLRDANPGSAPQIRLEDVRPVNLFDTNASGEVMERQISAVARAFADRAVLKGSEPHKWALLYAHGRKTLEQPMPHLRGDSGPGSFIQLQELAKHAAELEGFFSKLPANMSAAAWSKTRQGGVQLRARSLLKHAGFGGIKTANDWWSTGHQLALWAPRAQIRPKQPKRLAPTQSKPTPSAQIPDRPLAQYTVERLPNGFYQVYDRRSGLQQLFNEDGSPRHGPKLFPHLSAVPRYGQFNKRFDPKRRGGV